MKKTFLIEYKVFSTIDVLLKQGTIRVKNEKSEIAAKVGLESYLKKRVPGFGYLVIISCKEDNIFSVFADIFKR